MIVIVLVILLAITSIGTIVLNVKMSRLTEIQPQKLPVSRGPNPLRPRSS